MTFQRPLPERLTNIGYVIAHRLRRVVWRLLQPTTKGVKVITLNPSGHVLLVKARYLDQWTLPGGGVHKRETPEDAAARELREETGIRVDTSDLRLIGLLSSFKEGKSDYVAMFACEVGAETPPRPGAEIQDTAFFPLEDLPEPTSERTRRRINEFLHGEPMRGIW